MLLLVVVVVVPVALAAAPPPNHGVLFSVDAYGKLLAGHVVADAAVFDGLGLSLWTGTVRHSGIVPLVPGMRIEGLPKGVRTVEGAVDTLLLFDANADTYLDAKDPAFAALSLFVDANVDGRIGTGEVRRLGDIGVDSISRFGSVQTKEKVR